MLFSWWRRSRAARILVVTAAVFVAFAAMLLIVVRRDIAQTVETETRARVQTGADVMRGFASAEGEMRVSADGKLLFGSSVQNGDTALVDRVKQITGADATVFQIVAGKPIRIATTLTQDDKRIIGTELVGPARAAFDRGQDFDGISSVLGRAYLNHYALVHNDLGEPIAMLYDGIPLTMVDEAVAHAFTSILMTSLAAIAMVLVLLWAVVRPLGTMPRPWRAMPRRWPKGGSTTCARGPARTSWAGSAPPSRGWWPTSAAWPTWPARSPKATSRTMSRRPARATGWGGRSG